MGTILEDIDEDDPGFQRVAKYMQASAARPGPRPRSHGPGQRRVLQGRTRQGSRPFMGMVSWAGIGRAAGARSEPARRL